MGHWVLFHVPFHSSFFFRCHTFYFVLSTWFSRIFSILGSFLPWFFPVLVLSLVLPFFVPRSNVMNPRAWDSLLHLLPTFIPCFLPLDETNPRTNHTIPETVCSSFFLFLFPSLIPFPYCLPSYSIVFYPKEKDSWMCVEI